MWKLWTVGAGEAAQRPRLLTVRPRAVSRIVCDKKSCYSPRSHDHTCSSTPTSTRTPHLCPTLTSSDPITFLLEGSTFSWNPALMIILINNLWFDAFQLHFLRIIASCLWGQRLLIWVYEEETWRKWAESVGLLPQLLDKLRALLSYQLIPTVHQ